MGLNVQSCYLVIAWFCIVVVNAYSFTCLEPCLCTGITIDCKQQDLTSVPDFETINGANIVDLSNNDIQELFFDDFNWRGIEQLQFLYLNVNSIVYIEGTSFTHFPNLEYLDLSYNELDFLPPKMFLENRRLQTLKITGNFFGSATPAIISNTLEILDMSFCKLQVLTVDNLKHLPNLKQLNLMANNIAYVNAEIFSGHPNLLTTLSFNMWACNCSTVDLYNWAKQNEARIVIDDPLTCLNKNNIFIDLISKVEQHHYKESCNIDEDTFGVESIKELSLVKENVNDASVKLSELDKASAVLEEEYYYSTVVTVIIIIVIIVVSIAVSFGIVLGYFISKYQARRRKRESEWRISVDSFD